MIRKLLLLVSALSLSFSTTAFAEAEYLAPPTVDISAIRSLHCITKAGDEWVGSGFLIGDRIMVTALHVMADKAKCTDVDTHSRVYMYKSDAAHDLALVTGSHLPTNIPYIKYSCARFVSYQRYISWGRSPYGMDSFTNVITRENVIVPIPLYTKQGYTLDDGADASGMRVFAGTIAPGMSGGPVTNEKGEALSLNNAGGDGFTINYEFADGLLCGK